MGQDKKVKNLRRLASAAILAVMIFAVFISGACSASSYTEEEHLQRVSKRIDKQYIQSGEYKSFEIYPLYNENDELKYFLVDFEPGEHLYIKLNAEDNSMTIGCDPVGMYSQEARILYHGEAWRRYVVEEGIEPIPTMIHDGVLTEYPNRKFETDSGGNYIDYTESHFKVANIKDEKRYLLEIKQKGNRGLIPAVKRGEKYLNLVSMEEFEYEREIDEELYAISDITFIFSGTFDL